MHHETATTLAAGLGAPHPVVLKLSAAAPLSDTDVAILTTAVGRKVHRNSDIVAEGERLASVMFLHDGWACRYRLLGDGRKQVVNFLIPGDLVAFPMATARQFVAALTDVTLVRLPPQTPRRPEGPSVTLATAIDALIVAEFNMLAERTVSLGRRNAKERMAHMLLELYQRLDRVGLVRDRSFALPLTQEMMSDALGLSVVHVNRTLRVLRTEGLAVVGFGHATLRDLDGLIALADAGDGSSVSIDGATGLTPTARLN